MAIVLDEAYKFGAGRYIQGENVLEKVGKEILRVGKKAYIIGGPNALATARERLENGFKETELTYSFEEYGGLNTYEKAKEVADTVKRCGYDVMVGVGGGKMMDLAKACAYYAQVPVINIPTSIATCAAFTPLSVMYTTEGASLGSLRFEFEVSAVLVDMDIIIHEPPRYVAAGILDAMAKLIEIKNGHPVITLEAFPVDLFTSYTLAEYTYRELLRLARDAQNDVAANKLTKAVKDVTYMNIAVTGMISGISKGFGQSALGHEIYERIRTYFTREAADYLHGEIVAVGLLTQLYYNKTPEKVSEFKALMREMKMPACLKDINIEPTEENLKRLENGLLESPFVEKTPENLARLTEAMKCLV
jgi:glycerol dehydrogenase-like iron-containing ADH family enzyme